jgi:DinB superfamily
MNMMNANDVLIDLPKTARQTRYFQRLTEAKYRLLSSIAGLNQEEVCIEHITGDWTIKDIFGHIISWNEEFRSDIKSIQEDKHPGYEHLILGDDDFDQWNQQRIAHKCSWTWQCILDDLERDYQEALQLILRLEPKDFRKRGVTPWNRAALERPAVPTTGDTESIETLVTYHWRHMNQHARMIERWRKQRTKHDRSLKA